MSVEHLALPLDGSSIAWASLVRAGEFAPMEWMRESWWAGQLRYSQAKIQGFKLAHPNTYPINEWLECMNGLVLQIKNYRIPMTQTTTGYLRGVSVKFQY